MRRSLITVGAVVHRCIERQDGGYFLLLQPQKCGYRETSITSAQEYPEGKQLRIRGDGSSWELVA